MGRELGASRSQRYQMLPRRYETPFNRALIVRPPFTGDKSTLDIGTDSRVKNR